MDLKMFHDAIDDAYRDPRSTAYRRATVDAGDLADLLRHVERLEAETHVHRAQVIAYQRMREPQLIG